MKLTKKQISIIDWALDMDNNGEDWLYTRTKDGDTKVYIRRPNPENSNSADPDYWLPEEDITEEYVECCRRFAFWED